MKIKSVNLRNFRRFENAEIGFETDETVFVGPNNSGKTSATTAFRLFLYHPNFKVHDFSVSRIADLDAFGVADEINEEALPSIEMDLWFTIDQEKIEYGRVASLIPDISANLDEVGIRLKYCVKDANRLKSEYCAVFPSQVGKVAKKTLSHYLSLSGNLNRHFGLSYFMLEKKEGKLIHRPIDSEDGKRVLQSLLRVDFVDAQRNIDDQEISRSNRLSTAFAAFYKKNLEQAEVNKEANRIIDENNDNLTKHYDKHFRELMDVIEGLGVPSVNDRQLRIISSLSSEMALQGNTSLLYIDPTLNHELPEAYNGLGFKNLIYMAIQISHFHLQWMKTEEKRPLCQIIFIEEPEVHLHAQVQQAFISNIWNIVQVASKKAGEDHMVPQLGITTHSSHILDTVDFGKVRYFQRCVLEGEDPAIVRTLNASKVLSLRNFKPQKKSADGDIENENDTLTFLMKYMKLTHCDLFFADAAILVEGTAEKLLMNSMIDKSAPGLKRNYLTILEVGGAYAHRFASLLEFLHLPYLVITDLDSVDPLDKRTVCRADVNGALSSNSTLKFFLNKSSIRDLIALKPEEHILANGTCYVAFQKSIVVYGHDLTNPMYGRTFEEAIIYHNMQLVRENKIKLGIDFPTQKNFEEEYQAVFERVKSSSFKKTDFALDVASSTADWATPQYIADGLRWLEGKTVKNKIIMKKVSEKVLKKASKEKVINKSLS